MGSFVALTKSEAAYKRALELRPRWASAWHDHAVQLAVLRELHLRSRQRPADGPESVVLERRARAGPRLGRA